MFAIILLYNIRKLILPYKQLFSKKINFIVEDIKIQNNKLVKIILSEIKIMAIIFTSDAMFSILKEVHEFLLLFFSTEKAFST